MSQAKNQELLSKSRDDIANRYGDQYDKAAEESPESRRFSRKEEYPYWVKNGLDN